MASLFDESTPNHGIDEFLEMNRFCFHRLRRFFFRFFLIALPPNFALNKA